MSKPPVIDKKSLKTPDEFVQKGTQLMSRVAMYRTKVLPVAIAAAVIVVLGYTYQWWEERNGEAHWKTYFEATKLADAEKWASFKKIAEEGKSRAAFLASVSLADHHFDEAKKALLKDSNVIPADAETAGTWYSKALAYSGLVPNEKQLLTINLAQSLEMQKKYDDALAKLKTAAELPGELKGLALLDSGRNLELKNEKARAIETYEKVAADFLGTEYARTARNHVRRLNSPIFASEK